MNGYPRLHWPDLAVRTDEGLVVYEVELTAKAKWRLETIVRAWRRARDDVEQCVYLCPPSSPTQQVVHVRDQDGGCRGSGASGRVAEGRAMTTVQHEPWLTKRELALELRCSIRTIERLRLPAMRVGGQNRYRLSEVEAFLRGGERRGQLVLFPGRGKDRIA